MLGQAKRRRVALLLSVFVISTLVLLSARHRDLIQSQAQAGVGWITKQNAWKPYTPKGDMIQLNDGYPLTVTFRPGSAGRHQHELKIGSQVKDAHRYEDADDFWDPHFMNVTSEAARMTYKEARAGCTWGKDDKVNFMFAADDPWVLKPIADTEIHARRTQWQNWVTTQMLAWKEYKDRFDGRGIIIIGGNHNTLERIKVLLRALVKLDSRLPVQIHYWRQEIPDDVKETIYPLYHEGLLEFNDLDGDHNILKIIKPMEGMPAFGFKTAAMVNCKFEEILLLDADNIPVIKPEEVFESETYKEYHTVFWPDIARTRPENPMWAVSNTACRMDEYEQESGQVLVDKRRFWYHLQLAAWMNNQQSGYYNTYLLGDKDTFRFAWHMLKTKFGRPHKWLTSAGTVNKWDEKKPDGSVEHRQTYCGYDFAQFHPDKGRNQVAFMHGGLLKTVHRELLLWNKQQGGIFRHFKQVPTDTEWRKIPNVFMKWDGAEYFTNRSDAFAVPSCTDFPDIEAKPMDQLIPGWDKTFEEVGGYWLIDRWDLKPPY